MLIHFYVYVTNQFSDNSKLFQVLDNEMFDTIIDKKKPIKKVTTPDKKFSYSIDDTTNTIFVIQTADNSVINSIVAGTNPFGIAISSNGKYVYVLNKGSRDISLIQTADNTVVDTVKIRMIRTGAIILLKKSIDVVNEIIQF